jgi:alkylation response protein AidB-like acyl-CoA dehydrogenase
MRDIRLPATTAADELILGLTRVVGLPALTEAAGAPLSAADIEAVIREAERFAAERIAPGWQDADRQGAQYANGTVTTPAHYKDLYRAWIEGGWQGLAAPGEHGGQGLPHALSSAVTELASAADMAFMLCPILTAGAIDLLVAHATPDQAARWLPPLISAEWTGTMCLTEPQAGSDLGALRTRAEPIGEGRYAVTGQKIYITFGEHDLAATRCTSCSRGCPARPRVRAASRSSPARRCCRTGGAMRCAAAASSASSASTPPPPASCCSRARRASWWASPGAG